MDRTRREHQTMVRDQIAGRGISNPAILRAFEEVPREAFISPDLLPHAYDDSPLPIEDGQTISQPYVVALMISALRLSDKARVLEVGTGSGYAAALLGRIAKEVYTVERSEVLAHLAQERCQALGYDNVHVKHGDGTLGWLEQAPYDAIVVAAGGPAVPVALREQLAIGGRLVMPVGPMSRTQDLVLVRKLGPGHFDEESLGAVTFVPLIGVADGRTRQVA